MALWKILNKAKIINPPDLIKILLKNRGLSGKYEIEKFFHPTHPSNLELKELEISKTEINKAISRILKAKREKESVVVYTDYDADGVCGGTIVWETLHHLGLNTMPYIPHRIEEGYGLSEKGIDKVKKEYNAKLIITVDHGIVAKDKIKYAKKLGIDVIIIDHHIKASTPAVFAVIHTTKLCAAGVVWIFARELLRKIEYSHFNSKRIESYLDLVALATIADLVPLLGPNRSLVKYGLEALNKTKRIGLLALIKSAGLQKGNIGVYEVGHILAPRINAMGRLLHALDAMRLLCTKDSVRAYNLAATLNLTNTTRQSLTAQTILHAKSLYQKTPKKNKIIIIAHESYNQGIIGLVAGKLVEEYARPAIVISKGEVFSKASARSVNGFNIIDTIRSASDLLVDCGGHPMAAGFTVKTEYIELLQKRLVKIAEEQLKESSPNHTIVIDSQINLSDINWELYKNINSLQPFGMANPQAVFMTSDVLVSDSRLIGRDGKHLKMKISDGNGNAISAIAFEFGTILKDLIYNSKINIVFSLDEDNWNGNHNLQLKIKDVNIPKD